jgi:hypothetical protein
MTTLARRTTGPCTSRPVSTTPGSASGSRPSESPSYGMCEPAVPTATRSRCSSSKPRWVGVTPVRPAATTPGVTRPRSRRSSTARAASSIEPACWACLPTAPGGERDKNNKHSNSTPDQFSPSLYAKPGGRSIAVTAEEFQEGGQRQGQARRNVEWIRGVPHVSFKQSLDQEAPYVEHARFQSRRRRRSGGGTRVLVVPPGGL